MKPLLDKEMLRGPFALLCFTAVAMPVSLFTWQALINNFAVERAAFTGAEIGMMQSLREIPGFLSFLVVFLLVFIREQRLALLALLLLGIGTAVTGFFPTFFGLCVVTVVMSIGFHYFEAVNQSLTLQWLDLKEAPYRMGQLVSVGSFAALAAFGLTWMALELVGLDMKWVFFVAGGMTAVGALLCMAIFPQFPEKVEQHKKLILRERYWLFYALTFMAGARRQIFTVFAGFLMVEKFGFDAGSIALMFLANGIVSMLSAPTIGRLIMRWGERRALTVEYLGLIIVFAAYAFVTSPWVAVALYVIDHFFFGMAIARKTYFQKIADPRDIAPTTGVAFSINHIAAVVVPASFGMLWLVSPAAVFLSGAAMSGVSLVLARLVPQAPTPRHVALIGRWKALPDPEPAG